MAELYFLCRVTSHSAHFTNDRHWGHIPILLQYCGSCPRVRHDPYLPSISVSLQTPGRVELATILAIPLLSRIVSPRFYLILSASSGMFKKFDSERYHQSSYPRWHLAQTHKSKTLACFPSPSYYLLFRACQTLIFFSFFFPPRACQTLGSRRPPRPLDIRVCQTLTPHQSILQDDS